MRDCPRATYRDSERSQMLPVFLLRLSREQLGQEGDTVEGKVKRVDVMLSKVCEGAFVRLLRGFHTARSTHMQFEDDHFGSAALSKVEALR